ncbi:hypothetical protein PM082_023293 [Marasmius tenuissimus]|nr:hypothetical protein PM082_023293 [Marasmius tenuissimus]
MRSVIPQLIITAMSIVSTVGAVWLASGVITVAGTNFLQSTTIRDASYVWLISSSVTDVTITLCIIFVYVKRARNNRASGRSVADSQVSRVLKLSIESGTITALATISDLIVFLSVHTGPYFFIWDFSLSKLYTNSLLASLNARPTKTSSGPEPRAMLFIDDSTISSSSGGPSKRNTAAFSVQGGHHGYHHNNRSNVPLSVHYQTTTIATFDAPNDPRQPDIEMGTIPQTKVDYSHGI